MSEKPVDFIREDGLANVFASLGGANTMFNPLTGMGTARDKSTYTSVTPQRILTEVELDALYNGWLIRKVVDLVADEVTREGWQVIYGGRDADAEEVPGIEQELDDLDTYYIFNEAIKTARHYGGAGVILYINDGVLDPKEPVDEQNIDSIVGMEVVDRWRLLPSPEDTARGMAYNPTYYCLYGDYGRSLVYIHSSRVLRFDGLRLPYRERQRNQGWGLSTIQPIYDSFRYYFGGINASSTMLQEFDLFVHKIKGLSNLLAAGKESDVQKRLEVNELGRSIYRGMAIDADKEEVAFMNRSLNGVTDILKALKADITAASGIPHTLLFGESPGGLGSTGRSEERDFAKNCHSYQEQHIRKPLQQLLRYIFKSKNGVTRGRTPRNWDIRFRPLFILNEREEADLRARTAATDLRYIQAGVLTPQEVAMSRFGGASYSIETVLNFDLREEDGSLKEEYKPIQQQQGNAPMIGGGADPTDNENGSLEMEGQKTEGRLSLQEDSDIEYDESMFSDRKLHAAIVRAAKQKFSPYPSRYAGYWISQEYKRRYKKKHGSLEGAFKGSKPKSDAAEFKPKGKPLTRKQLESQAEITEEDIQIALEDWGKNAPTNLQGILEATSEEA